MRCWIFVELLRRMDLNLSKCSRRGSMCSRPSHLARVSTIFVPLCLETLSSFLVKLHGILRSVKRPVAFLALYLVHCLRPVLPLCANVPRDARDLLRPRSLAVSTPCALVLATTVPCCLHFSTLRITSTLLFDLLLQRDSRALLKGAPPVVKVLPFSGPCHPRRRKSHQQQRRRQRLHRRKSHHRPRQQHLQSHRWRGVLPTPTLGRELSRLP